MKIQDNSVSVDLNNVWFQMYAWGGVTTGQNLFHYFFYPVIVFILSIFYSPIISV